MIVSEQKTFDEILEMLRNYTKIFVVGCGDCATMCNSGGEKEAKLLLGELEKSGKTVTGFCVPDSTCVAAKLKTSLAKHLGDLKRSEAVVVLSCGLGVQSVKDNDRFGLAVVPGCDTTSAAVSDGKGNFIEKCAMCGQCVLDRTFGICPVTLCPKGLLNGPCGGMKNGYCEVDREQECAWAMIYNEARKKNDLGALKKVQEPKNYKKAVKPHKLMADKAV